MCDCAALCVLVASLHQINRMPVVCFTMSALPPLPLFESDSDAATLQMFESDSDAATPSWVTWSPITEYFMDSELFYNEVNADIDRQDMLRGLDAFIHRIRRPDPKICSLYCRCRGLRYVEPPLYVRRRRTRRIASHTITKCL